jgi:hypothetical protein
MTATRQLAINGNKEKVQTETKYYLLVLLLGLSKDKQCIVVVLLVFL